jgi:lipopolysaccharide/colanic/teichoic acid biosynthesis glycosyltransferase
MSMLDVRLAGREVILPWEHSPTAADRRYELCKRILDVIVAVTSLVLLSPLLIVMAIAVKLTSKGPVFYRGTVHGRYGVPFTWHKFRTMKIDAGDNAHRQFILAYVAESRGSQGPAAAASGVYKLTPDPRVTRVGASVAYEYEMYTEEDKDRLRVLPGITGLAQVRARSKCSFAEMVALDREYIANRSLALDLRIMLETVWVILTGKGAY